MSDKQQFFRLKDEQSTKDLAILLASVLKQQDVLLLHGDLGVGKTTFSKYFIRSYLNEPSIEVPSPTFTLVQHYGEEKNRLDHYDCYRLEDEEEILEIGLEESFSSALSLIEWPDKIVSFLPVHASVLGLKIDSNDITARIGFLQMDEQRMAGIMWPDTIELLQR